MWTFQWHTIFANCPTVTCKYDFIKHLISQKKNRYDPIDSLLELNELYLTFSILQLYLCTCIYLSTIYLFRRRFIVQSVLKHIIIYRYTQNSQILSYLSLYISLYRERYITKVKSGAFLILCPHTNNKLTT